MEIAHIDAVVLSHAHIDHAGRLPFLVHEGYAKRILATTATRRSVRADARRLRAHPGTGRGPISRGTTRSISNRSTRCATPCARSELMRGVPYDQPFDVVPGVKATFVDAGHILGLGVGRLGLHERRDDEATGVQRRHWAKGASDHPRSRAARRRARGDHGEHVWQSRSPERSEREGRARTHRARYGGARRTSDDSGVRGRTHAGNRPGVA